MARSDAPAASGRLAPKRSVRGPAARQRLRPDAEIVCGEEVSFLNLPLPSRHSITSSASVEVVYTVAQGQVISPLSVALVEGVGRRDIGWCLPATTDSLGARKAKAAHQINPVVAQSKIGRRALDGFYARDFNLRQGRCRGVGRPQRLRLLRISGKRPGDCRTAEKRDEIAPPH